MLKLITDEGDLNYIDCDGAGLFVGSADGGGFRVVAITTSPVTGSLKRHGYVVLDKANALEAARSVAYSLRSILMNELLEDHQKLREIGERAIMERHKGVAH